MSSLSKTSPPSTSPLTSPSTALPSSLQDLVRAELHDDERVLWQAQPIAAQRLRSGFGIWLIGVPWTAFSVFGTVVASHGSMLLAMFGLPFVAVGALMLSAPWIARRTARHSVYVVTDRRVLLIEETIDLRGAHMKIKSVKPTGLERRQRTDGSGSILFPREGVGAGDNVPPAVGLLDIADVAEVEKLIRRTLLDG